MNTFDDDDLLADGLYRLGSTAPVPSAEPCEDVRRGRRRVRRNRLVATAGTVLAVGIIGIAGVVLQPMLADRASDPAGSPTAVSSSERAASVARVLPSSYDLAVNLMFERDALMARVPDVVVEPMSETTDESITTWATELRQVDVGGDRELVALVTEIQQSLDGLPDLRQQIRSTDTVVEAQLAYTEIANDLFAISARVPSVGHGDIDSEARALANARSLFEATGEQRAIMIAALGSNDVDADEFADLAHAEAAWRLSLADFYDKTSDGQRASLDEITNGTATDGAIGVPAQQAVDQVLAAGNLDQVTMGPDEYVAASTDLIRSMQNLIVAAATELTEKLEALD